MGSLPVRLLGVVLALVGIALSAVPHRVAEALGRPHETAGQVINARASFGGTVVGVGLLLAAGVGFTPGRVFALSALMYLMVGIGVVRAAGFVLDGKPDTLQWVWLIAEAVIALGSAYALSRSVA